MKSAPQLIAYLFSRGQKVPFPTDFDNVRQSQLIAMTSDTAPPICARLIAKLTVSVSRPRVSATISLEPVEQCCEAAIVYQAGLWDLSL